MRLDVGLGRFDQGFIPATMAAWAFPCMVLPHPILADMEAQELKPGLIALQGVTDATFGVVRR
jgi:hypothetical protein